MDGTHKSVIATGHSWPRGLKINFKDSRLYFATHKPGKRIQTTDLQGKDVRPAVTMIKGGFTYGIGFWNGRIYWSDRELKALKSGRMKMNGAMYKRVIKVDYKGKDTLMDLVVVPRIYPTNKRENDCEKKNCPNICALTPEASSCVAEDGL